MYSQKAKAMRAARYRRGWTQFDLARRVGCSESQIAKIETGRTKPSPILREAICRVLKVGDLEVRP